MRLLEPFPSQALLLVTPLLLQLLLMLGDRLTGPGRRSAIEASLGGSGSSSH